MNCSYCQIQFDHSAHTPRLLIFCGHSLCEKCCHQLHTNSRIQCPQCLSNTFIEQVNFLPKNLALLKANMSTINTQGYCLKHEKKFEAFCNKQKILICVDCILHDSHRNHEMDSIKNAYTIQQQNLHESLQSIQQSLNRNQAKYDENLSSQKQYIDQYQSTTENIHQYFEQLRSILQKEQQNQLAKLKEQYDTNIIKFQEKNNKFVDKIDQLAYLLSGLKKYCGLADIQFLNSVTVREEILGRASLQVQEALKIVSTPFQKSFIGEAVLKIIEKGFKQPNNSGNNSSTNTPGCKTPQVGMKSKKTSSQHGQQLIKQYESMQPPAQNQNTKPMSKKPIKKQLATSPIPSTLLPVKSPINPLIRVCPNMEADKKSPKLHRPRASSSAQNEKFELPKHCDISIVEQKQSLFNSFFSNMTSFLTESKQIYLIGGFDQDNSNILKFNITNFNWEEITTLKSPRSKFGCVVVDKNIYIIGGKKGKERVSDVEIWGANGCWKTGTSLKKKRSGFGIVSYEQFIYVIGGNDGENILSSVEIYNTTTNEWSRAQSMHQPRDQLAACIGKDQRIYAIGGFGGKNNQSLKTVQAFDVVSQKWHKVPSLNVQRRALAAASLADGIYAIGGFDGSKHLNSVQKYEQGSSQWVQVASLKRGRCTHSAISIFDSQQIIIMGGFDEQALDSIQKYSLITNQWQQIAKMPSPRFMHSSVLMSE